MAKDESPADKQRRLQFAKLVNQLIEEANLGNNVLAEKLGYDNQNVISMFKSGKTRLPLEQVAPFAIALNYDPGSLMHDWFAAYMPDALPSIEEHMGMALSRVERGWITNLRKIFGRVPPFDQRIAGTLKSAIQGLNSIGNAA